MLQEFMEYCVSQGARQISGGIETSWGWRKAYLGEVERLKRSYNFGDWDTWYSGKYGRSGIYKSLYGCSEKLSFF